MSNRYTKFKSNYLMRSRHQKTELGTILERDWVTTNGLNPLRFGAGRRAVYNVGNFVFTTSNIPSYHKKHKLYTETKEWKWDDCKSADGTVNTVEPSFNTTDLRDYAYYGSCVELIRATIEDIISDFPGRLKSIDYRPTVDGEYINDYENLPNPTLFENCISYKANTDDWMYCIKKDENTATKRNDWEWNTATKVKTESDAIKSAESKGEGIVYYITTKGLIRISKKNAQGKIYFESYGIPSGEYRDCYVHSIAQYYYYDYNKQVFVPYKVIPDGYVDGFLLNNPFQIDLHHKKVTLGKYDNEMRFMAHSWNKYCVKEIDEDGEGEEQNIYSYIVEDIKTNSNCTCSLEGQKIKKITFITGTNKNEDGKIIDEKSYVVYAYYVNKKIVYVYKPTNGEELIIQPQQKYIDEYFASLKGFKKQLLRQDTKPYYKNVFKTPTEYNFVWYYPEKTYTLPSDGYCINIESMGFSTFIDNLYNIAQNFDDMWSDNLYRSMTHEAIKNFDNTYSREYYEGEEQDNVDGGERMQKIIRIMGRVFDDVKLYMDTLKLTPNVTYDCIKNGVEAQLSDLNDLKGIDVKSTIKTHYENSNDENLIDEKITKEFLKTVSKDNDSKLSTWYPTRNSEDVYPDVCDNEFMRRLLLSTKRIMQTKGTQESIEMIFGLFGLGRGVDYEIEEEAFYTEKMILSEECVNGDYTTIDENGDTKTIKSGEDWSKTSGVDWKDVDSTTKGDLAIEINSYKDLSILYEEDTLSGTPMREVYLGRDRTPYVVPYYDGTQLYDGDLVFQGKGGWGKMVKENDADPLDDSLDYQETLSYLHVVDNMGELLSLNPNILDNNVIYYVVNLNDYTDYDENPPMISVDSDDVCNLEGITMSHYFILVNKYHANELWGWKNVVVKPSLDAKGSLQMIENVDEFQSLFGDGDEQEWAYSPKYLTGEATDEEKLGTYIYAFKKMQYMDNIISTNVGNNPHTGYGYYDDGMKYIETMKLPFKYIIDNNHITNYSLRELAKKYSFDDIGENRVTDKIQIMNSRNSENESDFIYYQKETCDDGSENYVFKGEKIDSYLWHFKGERMGYYDWYLFKGTKIEEECDEDSIGIIYTLNDDAHNVRKRWYINTKVLTITNKLESELYNEYFKTVIMPYVMQVIPSTTILKLKNFS